MSGKERILLVLDYDPSHNWYEYMKGVVLDDGSSIQVHQTSWGDITVNYDPEKGCMVEIQAAEEPIYGTNQKNMRQIVLTTEDFICVRNFPRGIHGVDYKNVLMGLLYAGIPAMNSLHSIYMCLERPIVYAELLKIRRREGKDKFPLIDQYYYPNCNSGSGMLLTKPKLPMVVKSGSAHAGYGKVCITEDSSTSFEDVYSVLGLQQDYFTVDPFMTTNQYDIRLQKIGNHYRCFKRFSEGWKKNWGNITTELIEESDEKYEGYKFMMDQCSDIFGGLDMFALDLVHLENGDELILELNDTAMGLRHEEGNEEEDQGYIVDLVVEKWNAVLNDVGSSKSE